MNEIYYEDLKSVSIKNKNEASKYLCKSICYLREIDIDKSGRGYYFLRYMKPVAIENKEFVDANGSRVEYNKIIKILDI